MSIRSRLLLLVFGVWLPAVVGFGLLANQAYRNEQELASRRIEEQARSLSLLTERALDTRAAVSRVLASSAAVRDRDLGDFHREASRVAQASESTIGLLDAHGHWLSPPGRARGAPGQPAFDLPDQQGIPPLARGEIEANLAYQRDDGKPIITVLAPEPGVVEQHVNVVTLFPVASVQALIEAQRPFEEGVVVAVMDRRQRVVARSVDPQRWIGKSATGEISRLANGGHSGFVTSVTLDGVSSSSYLSPDNRYGWRVVIAVPQANLARSAQKLTFQTVAGSAVLLLIGLAVAFHNARRIGSAVHALHGAAGELGEDQVPPRLRTAIREVDEVGTVLNRAGSMIQESTRQLEARVREAVQEAKDAQSRLLEAQKHEAIGRLTGGLAHDFNNLLQAIHSALEILELRSATDADRSVIEAALRATIRATDLVRQMLAFGRSQPLRSEAVDLGELIRGSQLLSSKAVGERVRLSFEVEPDLPRVLVDPTQLELAVLNLLFNARDALAEAGGRIFVTLRRAGPADHHRAHGSSGEFVCLDVSDDGPGMADEVISRAFDPYYTTKPKGRGSGLGLAQVLAFARQSGGDAWIDSRAGEGSRVSLMLPIADGSACGLPVADSRRDVASVEPGTAPLHVLMVEDDPLVSDIVVPALEQAGHRITHCSSADAAMALLERGRAFDVLFSDIVMPGRLSGLDLAAWCRRECPTLPVVLATGYSDQQAPPDRVVLSKPYSIETLIRSLIDAIGRAEREAVVNETST